MTEDDLVADLLNLFDQDLIELEPWDDGQSARVDLTANGHAYMLASCDHEFADSVSCVKCGWTPTAGQLVTGSGTR